MSTDPSEKLERYMAFLRTDGLNIAVTYFLEGLKAAGIEGERVNDPRFRGPIARYTDRNGDEVVKDFWVELCETEQERAIRKAQDN